MCNNLIESPNEKRNLAKELAWVVKQAMIRNSRCFGNITIKQMDVLASIIIEEMPALLDSWNYNKNKSIDSILDSI